MALKEYRCNVCGSIQCAFEGEEHRLNCCINPLTLSTSFEKLFPMATVVHATDIFMLIQLDTIDSIHDLQEVRIIRAGRDREVKQLNEFRKNI